jgi:hypothetical protein
MTCLPVKLSVCIESMVTIKRAFFTYAMLISKVSAVFVCVYNITWSEVLDILLDFDKHRVMEKK